MVCFFGGFTHIRRILGLPASSLDCRFCLVWDGSFCRSMTQERMYPMSRGIVLVENVVRHACSVVWSGWHKYTWHVIRKYSYKTQTAARDFPCIVYRNHIHIGLWNYFPRLQFDHMRVVNVHLAGQGDYNDIDPSMVHLRSTYTASWLRCDLYDDYT